MSFDLKHRPIPEKKGNIERPAVQPGPEGRWHVYHLTIDGCEDEMKAFEEKRNLLGGPLYDWRMTMLLHESRPLNKKLVDKVLHWQLSSPGTPTSD
jgi:hypothetical protein